MNKPFITYKNNRIEAIIFDMDGTIVPNKEFHLEAWRQFCRQEGIIASDERLLSTFGATNQEIFQSLINKPLTHSEFMQLANTKELLYRQAYLGKVVPTQGLKILLDRLILLQIPVALATSAPTDNVVFTLTQSGLGSYFKTIVDSTSITFSKPHPEIFLKTAELLHIQPKNCLVFEDAPLGIKAAQTAGMAVIALTTTFSLEQLPTETDHISHFDCLEFADIRLTIK